jgi:hypothetical protein
MFLGDKMSTNQSQYIYTGLFFLFIFISGFWLSRGGKPYGVGIFTVHKLIGLAAGIYLGVRVYRAHQTAPLGEAEIAAILVTVVLFISTVVAGGLLSTEESMPAFVSLVHKISPYIIVASTIVTLFLLHKRE